MYIFIEKKNKIALQNFITIKKTSALILFFFFFKMCASNINF